MHGWNVHQEFSVFLWLFGNFWIKVPALQVQTCSLTGNAEESSACCGRGRTASAALPGINLSRKSAKVAPHSTATFPSQRRTSDCLDDSRKAPNPQQTTPGSVSAGRVLAGSWKNISMLSLGTKKRDMLPRVDWCAEELPQVKPVIS